MKRDYGLDFVRLIAFIFVVCVHSLPNNINYIIYEAGQALFFTCNGMFYMLSGYFALKADNKETIYSNYFLHKLFSLVIPFIILSLILQLRYYGGNIEGIFNIEFVKSFLMAFLCSNSNSHLWFMYPLIGMTLSAPIWEKMLFNLDNNMIKLMIIFSLSWNLIFLTILSNLGYGNAFSGNPLNGWIFLFVLGYCYKINLHHDINREIMIIAGIICFFITVIQKTKFPNHAGYAHDLSAVYIIFTYVVFLFLNYIGNKIKCGNIISFLAKHTFPAYVFHYCILDKVKEYTGIIENRGIYYILTVSIVAMLSLLIGLIMDLIVVNPIKKIEKLVMTILGR